MKTKIKKERNQKGITLIALVVTIVVLIILSVISVQAVFSDSGIIKQAEKAREKQQMAQIKEEAEMVKMDYLAEYFTGDVDNSKLEQSMLLIKLKRHFDRNIKRK